MNVSITYTTECGKTFDIREKALIHELMCSCHTNPKMKACTTCKYSSKESDPYSTMILRVGSKEYYCSMMVRSPMYNDYKNAYGHKYIRIECPCWQGKEDVK